MLRFVAIFIALTVLVAIVAFSFLIQRDVPCTKWQQLRPPLLQAPRNLDLPSPPTVEKTGLPVTATGVVTPMISRSKVTLLSEGEGIAICIRIRNEAPNLAEWLAFHMAVGVSKVVILDDGSTDNPRLETQPFEQCGFVDYHIYNISSGAGPGRPNSEPVRKQMEPLNECMAHLQHKCTDSIRWLALIDADEFLFPGYQQKTLPEIFENLSDYHCVTVPRMQFGAAGHIKRPRDLTIRSFQQRSAGNFFKSNRYPKLVVNLKPKNQSLQFKNF